jgi:hypothetical protein
VIVLIILDVACIIFFDIIDEGTHSEKYSLHFHYIANILGH